MDEFFVIIGKLPPPIGGVRVHVARLLEWLNYHKMDHKFVVLSPWELLTSITVIFNSRFIHLHSSNVWARFFFAFLCFIFRKKLLITYHGNLGRFNYLKNCLDYCSIFLCYVPIVLNRKSHIFATQLNSNAKYVSAFIPPISDKIDVIPESVNLFKEKKFEAYFCTNAWRVTYDNDAKEIYGISSLVEIFRDLPKFGLIISDPSGSYANFFKSKQIELTGNILIIPIPHSFIKIIRSCDCMIRATTTDGDSISIREALYFEKPVIASNCVERPEGCILYGNCDFAALKKIIMTTDFGRLRPQASKDTSGGQDLLELYRSCMYFNSSFKGGL
ncbi:MAG: hypothetical protein C0412_01595 [Flavobacterium sp.]|nr:hypothetical protein [Flavobacterium sp.]